MPTGADGRTRKTIGTALRKTTGTRQWSTSLRPTCLVRFVSLQQVSRRTRNGDAARCLPHPVSPMSILKSRLFRGYLRIRIRSYALAPLPLLPNGCGSRNIEYDT